MQMIDRYERRYTYTSTAGRDTVKERVKDKHGTDGQTDGRTDGVHSALCDLWRGTYVETHIVSVIIKAGILVTLGHEKLGYDFTSFSSLTSYVSFCTVHATIM